MQSEINNLTKRSLEQLLSKQEKTQLTSDS